MKICRPGCDALSEVPTAACIVRIPDGKSGGNIATLPYYHAMRVSKNSVNFKCMYRVILSVLDPRKCEYLKDYSLDFEHAYMTTYLAS